jgi:glycine cleavage system H protein
MLDKKARYLETHEWARLEQGGSVSVGLSKYAIDQLGDIVYMELPEVGRELVRGEPFGVVESVKTASDMYAPVGGKVAAVNSDVPNNPDILKTDAYGRGWLIRIEPSDLSQYEGLMTAEAYQKFLETEA